MCVGLAVAVAVAVSVALGLLVSPAIRCAGRTRKDGRITERRDESEKVHGRVRTRRSLDASKVALSLVLPRYCESYLPDCGVRR